jgi:hypothetical protein
MGQKFCQRATSNLSVTRPGGTGGGHPLPASPPRRTVPGRKFQACCCAGLLVLTELVVAAGAKDYLPAVGPTPLRFAPTTSPATPVSWKLLNPPAGPTNNAIAANPADPAAGAAGGTNSVDTAFSPVAAATNQNPIFSYGVGFDDTNYVDLLIAPEVLNLPPANTPLITPQILAEYLHPEPHAAASRSVGVLVPVEVGFKPPVAAPTAESRAVYKSQ